MDPGTISSLNRARSRSGSTLKVGRFSSASDGRGNAERQLEHTSIRCSLAIHNDTHSRDPIIFSAHILEGTSFSDGDLVEIVQASSASDVQDFAKAPADQRPSTRHRRASLGSTAAKLLSLLKYDIGLSDRRQIEGISIHKHVATMLGFSSPATVTITKVDKQRHASSHVEICFRDAYLSRSDMWRFTNQELVGKSIYTGQKVSFLGSLKATIRKIHVQGQMVRTAYFSANTVPVFRSEAARYVIFIQMSKEMWDFDSEGDGEILFNRVVNGFLPDLFKRWSSLELRHLVSIVMFGRLEYRNQDTIPEAGGLSMGLASRPAPFTADAVMQHQDFYRVVVTDMASAQWTTILEELKRDFRVFLRDVSLFQTPDAAPKLGLQEERPQRQPRISGRLSPALQGNILEAINLAASQFSDDYVDRDLIRTGISTVVITAGSGVFDVDRELLKLTSETLTNNGIGIDIVCLSQMPLHSVPLFRYRLPYAINLSEAGSQDGISPTSLSATLPRSSLPDLSGSPAFSGKATGSSYFSRFPSAFPARLPQYYGYGIPQWIDLSYWSSENRKLTRVVHPRTKDLREPIKNSRRENFVPRVRMYSLQMEGLLEMSMADISIPYLKPTSIDRIQDLQKISSRLSASRYGQSFSRSPEMKRKTASLGASGIQQLSKKSTLGGLHDLERTMDAYDKSAFQVEAPKVARGRPNKQSEPTPRPKVGPTPKNDEKSSMPVPIKINQKAKPEKEDRTETASITSNSTGASRPARAPRNFSYGLKGLMPLFQKTAAKAEVQAENINAQKLTQLISEEASDDSSSQLSPQISRQDSDTTQIGSQRPITARSDDDSSPPIKISANASTKRGEPLTAKLWQQRRQQRDHSDDNTKSDGGSATSDDEDASSTPPSQSMPNSLPNSKIPFVQNVNASNPLKRKANFGAFGRWQHLYPRKPKSATVKWRSLCTPASVPLTTADFPDREELDTGYEAICHVVHAQRQEEGTSEARLIMHTQFLEMISLRVAHGYQFIVGDKVKAVIDEPLADYHEVWQPEAAKKPRLVVVLGMGNSIQKLELYNATFVRITRYFQKTDPADLSTPSCIAYEPYVRTILANDYFPRHLTLKGFSEHYPWDIVDNHLAGRPLDCADPEDQLRYWRARFVLLPVEPPSSMWKKHQQDENEEEIHLLGIRALTQLLQKNRYISAQDRVLMQKRMGSNQKRDDNPLEVKMETLNLSELVALEMDRLAQIEDDGEHQSTQLLPEPEKLDRETSMAKFAQAMQSERGIEIKHRRWHLKLHYSCFHGEEFTNWLLHNVRNLATREEAVEFGNQLMKEGLFEHVNGRHSFKDGHYFYSMRPQYRQQRPDLTKSWFSIGRASDKSMPATPALEQVPVESSPLSGRTRSASNLAQQLHTMSSEDKKQFSTTSKKRKTVSLARVIRVDVDPKKKSFNGRPEVINVYYDRFANPENCYHLQISWLSATCKLVDDAITLWTNTVEKYGLKLVEVPIAEAVDVPSSEPFRNPYRVKVEAPNQKSTSMIFNPGFFTSSPFSPQGALGPGHTDKHILQKALLKRFNFVLDVEALSEFPDTVDVHWGRLSYKYTQFVHRSGIIVAQIVEDGDIILLANRLYNSRLATTKDASNRMFDAKNDSGPQSHRPAVPPTAAASMQASGIVGINLASPNPNSTASPSLRPMPFGITAEPSPGLRPSTASQSTTSDPYKPAIADTFGPKSGFGATGNWTNLVTPEQIKDELEAFCLDKPRLEAFYRDAIANATAPVQSVPGSGSRKATGSSSSSLLKPIRELPGTMASDIMGIPAFELPEAVTAVRELRRATVAYESVSEMYDRSKIGSRNGSVGSGHEEGNGKSGNGGLGALSPLRKAAK